MISVVDGRGDVRGTRLSGRCAFCGLSGDVPEPEGALPSSLPGLSDSLTMASGGLMARSAWGFEMLDMAMGGVGARVRKVGRMGRGRLTFGKAGGAQAVRSSCVAVVSDE